MAIKKKRWGLSIVFIILGLCLGGSLILALVNLSVPQKSSNPGQLSDVDVEYVLEVQQFHKELGNEVFPGLGEQTIPVILYNEEYAFLIGMKNPSAGWVKVPQEQNRGDVWQPMPAVETFPQLTYYRSTYDPQRGPDAFTVRVGESYVSSMPTKEWFKISLMDNFRTDLPSFIKPLFPYSLAANLFLPNTDTYLSLIQHESFHAFQAVWAPQRFIQAELDGIQIQDQYPWENETGAEAWKIELTLLQTALQTENNEETKILVQKFLDQRESRRILMNLSPDLIRYENQREWVEGMARYSELESWRLASGDDLYQPLKNLEIDSNFKNYDSFGIRWKRELEQMVRMANDEGDGRFYYSGMAQAFLLDRLYPSWKEILASDPMFNLEDLLKQALIEK